MSWDLLSVLDIPGQNMNTSEIIHESSRSFQKVHAFVKGARIRNHSYFGQAARFY